MPYVGNWTKLSLLAKMGAVQQTSNGSMAMWTSMLALRYYLAALTSMQIRPKECHEAALLFLWKKLGAIPVSAMNIKFCSGCSAPLKVTMKAWPLLTINSLLENLLVWWSLAFSFRCQLVLDRVAAMKKWKEQENLRVYPRRKQHRHTLKNCMLLSTGN